jgi:16S rRNA (guanine527-N7)-methyltransferase
MYPYSWYILETKRFHVERGSRDEISPNLTENGPYGRAWFLSVCRRNQFEIREKQIDQLEEFIGLLLEWNKKVNLISRKDEKNIWRNHILHCASMLFQLSLPRGARILDIGTGGGLPGIPLKILQPDLQVTLLDSIQKKVNAVGDIVSRLSIPGLIVRRGRAEEMGKTTNPQHRFDIATARAVAPLRNLISWCRPILGRETATQPILAHSGKRIRIHPPALLAMKGGDLTEELHQIRGLAEIRSVQTIRLAQNDPTKNSDNDKYVVCILFHSKNDKN